MLQDVEFFSTKLGKIDGFGDAGTYLADIVKSKDVKPAAQEAGPATVDEDAAPTKEDKAVPDEDTSAEDRPSKDEQ